MKRTVSVLAQERETSPTWRVCGYKRWFNCWEEFSTMKLQAVPSMHTQQMKSCSAACDTFLEQQRADGTGVVRARRDY